MVPVRGRILCSAGVETVVVALDWCRARRTTERTSVANCDGTPDGQQIEYEIWKQLMPDNFSVCVNGERARNNRVVNELVVM